MKHIFVILLYFQETHLCNKGITNHFFLPLSLNFLLKCYQTLPSEKGHFLREELNSNKQRFQSTNKKDSRTMWIHKKLLQKIQLLALRESKYPLYKITYQG